MQVEPFGVLTLDSTSWREVRNWFLGIAYGDEAIILGHEGFSAYRAEHGLPDLEDFGEGRYIAVLERDEYFTVLTDPMGQDAIYYYSPEHFAVGGSAVSRWVISNSVISLARKARQFGALELYRPSMLGFQVLGGKGMGAQLFSNNTPVRGAQVLPLGCELRISKRDGSASVHRVRSGEWLAADDGRDYVELLTTYVRKSLARCSALRSTGHLDLLCDVSGGHDSRAVMGMLERSFGSTSVVYTSDANKSQDYKVARRLARHFGEQLNLQSQVPVSLGGQAAFEIWKHASAGVYLPIVQPRAEHEARRLRFHGGNFLSKEFGETPAHEKVQSFTKWIKTGPDDRQMVANEFMQSFDHIDVDATAPLAMQMHYINFRGRFHYGRNWYSHTRAPMITPLISPLLAKAAFRLTPDAYNRSQVSLDLLLALDNELTTIPFDSPEKNFPTSEVEASPFWKNSVAFDAGKADLPKVYGLDTVMRSQRDPAPPEGPAFMEVFRGSFPDLLERVRDAQLFGEPYLEKAAREGRAPSAPAHRMRAAAHVVHTGLLLAEMS